MERNNNEARGDVDLLVDVALIRERYGVMRKEMDSVLTYVEAAKSERTWYKGYAAATIFICTMTVTGVTYVMNNHVIQRVDELVHKQQAVSRSPLGPVKQP